MTIQWIEGFEIDQHSIALSRAYQKVDKTRFNRFRFPGRSGGFYLRVANDSTNFVLAIEDGGVKDINPNNIDTLIIGWAFRGNFLADWKGKAFTLWQIFDNTTLATAPGQFNIQVIVASDGKSYEWRIRRHLTVLGTTSVSLINDEWYYVECKVKVHSTLGTIDIEVDGVSELSLTTQNTSKLGSGVWGHIQLFIPKSPTTSYIDLDDFYIVSAESTNPDFLGSIFITQKYPWKDSFATSPGPFNDWTKFGANLFSRAEAVDDSQQGIVDDDVSFVEARLDDLKQSFVLIADSIIDDDNILATTWNIDARIVSQGSKNIAPIFWEPVGGLVTGANVVINSTSYMRRMVVNESSKSSSFKLDVAVASEHGFETKA